VASSGTASEVKSCTVRSIHPTAVVVAVPGTIDAGDSVSLAWMTKDTAYCSLFGPDGLIKAGASTDAVRIESLDTSTRFAIVCATEAGQPFAKEIDVQVRGSSELESAKVPVGTMVGIPSVVPGTTSYGTGTDSTIGSSGSSGGNSQYDTSGVYDGSDTITTTPVQVQEDDPGTFTATDAQGNVIRLCDPAVGIDAFITCLSNGRW